jgi:uncharacterized membrane protein
MRVVREALALLGVAGSVLLLVVNWSSIPGVMPVHFGLNGAPNRFAPKQELWLIAGIGVAVYLVLALVSRITTGLNLPAQVGDPDRPRQEAIAHEMIAWLRLETAWIFAYVIWTEVEIAHRERAGLNDWPLVVLLATVFATCAIFLVRMFRGSTN